MNLKKRHRARSEMTSYAICMEKVTSTELSTVWILGNEIKIIRTLNYSDL
jgi:hypothetical protein